MGCPSLLITRRRPLFASDAVRWLMLCTCRRHGRRHTHRRHANRPDHGAAPAVVATGTPAESPVIGYPEIYKAKDEEPERSGCSVQRRHRHGEIKPEPLARAQADACLLIVWSGLHNFRPVSSVLASAQSLRIMTLQSKIFLPPAGHQGMHVHHHLHGEVPPPHLQERHR